MILEIKADQMVSAGFKNIRYNQRTKSIYIPSH